MLAVHRHRQPCQARSWAISAGVAQVGSDDGIHQLVGDEAICQRLAQQITGLVVARRGLQHPRRRQRQPLLGDLAAHVIQHHRMQRVKPRLLPPILSRLVRLEYRQAEVVVGIARQVRCHIGAAQPRTAKPYLAGCARGVPREADHNRAHVGQIVAEHGAEKLAVADQIGFAGFIGFHRAGWKNCRGRVHHRP